jgi:nicotinate-nucleotide adenylyltransferase
MVQTAGSIQKIGLLGGTFDPVHNGHLAVASHVLQHLGLNAILFIPAF